MYFFWLCPFPEIWYVDRHYSQDASWLYWIQTGPWTANLLEGCTRALLFPSLGCTGGVLLQLWLRSLCGHLPSSPLPCYCQWPAVCAAGSWLWAGGFWHFHGQSFSHFSPYCGPNIINHFSVMSLHCSTFHARHVHSRAYRLCPGHFYPTGATLCHWSLLHGHHQCCDAHSLRCWAP